MAITESEYRKANQAAQDRRASGYAVSVRYDRRSGRVVVRMSTGIEIRFPAYLVEGLSGASPEDLAKIEISPSGLGLHWPSLDVDLYLPGVIAGQFGSTRFLDKSLDEGYRAMAADQEREAEAIEWCNALARDMSDETR